MEVAPTRAINPSKISFDDLDLEEDGKEGLQIGQLDSET